MSLAESHQSIRVFAMPVPACSYDRSWPGVVETLQKRINDKTGLDIRFQFIEVFSENFFSFPDVVKGFQENRYEAPLVLLGNEVIQSGGKLSEKKIKEFLINQNTHNT